MKGKLQLVGPASAIALTILGLSAIAQTPKIVPQQHHHAVKGMHEQAGENPAQSEKSDDKQEESQGYSDKERMELFAVRTKNPSPAQPNTLIKSLCQSLVTQLAEIPDKMPQYRQSDTVYALNMFIQLADGADFDLCTYMCVLQAMTFIYTFKNKKKFKDYAQLIKLPFTDSIEEIFEQDYLPRILGTDATKIVNPDEIKALPLRKIPNKTKAPPILSPLSVQHILIANQVDCCGAQSRNSLVLYVGENGVKLSQKESKKSTSQAASGLSVELTKGVLENWKNRAIHCHTFIVYDIMIAAGYTKFEPQLKGVLAQILPQVSELAFFNKALKAIETLQINGDLPAETAQAILDELDETNDTQSWYEAALKMEPRTVQGQLPRFMIAGAVLDNTLNWQPTGCKLIDKSMHLWQQYQKRDKETIMYSETCGQMVHTWAALREIGLLLKNCNNPSVLVDNGPVATATQHQHAQNTITIRSDTQHSTIFLMK